MFRIFAMDLSHISRYPSTNYSENESCSFYAASFSLLLHNNIYSGKMRKNF